MHGQCIVSWRRVMTVHGHNHTWSHTHMVMHQYYHAFMWSCIYMVISDSAMHVHGNLHSWQCTYVVMHLHVHYFL